MRTRVIAALIAVLLGVGGTVGLVTYVQGSDARALERARPVDVLVASGHIPKGTPASALVGLIEVRAVPKVALLADPVSSLDQLANQVTLVDLLPGEQLVTARFADPETARAGDRPTLPDGLQEVTVQLEPERAIGGNVAAGDTVGVFASFTGDNPTTQLALHKILVTRVQAAPMPSQGDAVEVASGPAPLPTGDYLVSLAVNTAAAERIVFAKEHGSVWLSNEPLSADE